MTGFGQLHDTTETWFEEVLRETASTVVTLYRRNVSGEYVPVFWVPRKDGLEPPLVSSASDLASYLRGLQGSSFEMDGETFKDSSVRRGLEAFGISVLFAMQLPGNGSGRYFLTAGKASPYDDDARELLEHHAQRVAEALSSATLRARVRGSILQPYEDGSGDSGRSYRRGCLAPLKLLADTVDHGSFAKLVEATRTSLGISDLNLSIEDHDGLLLAESPRECSSMRARSWLTLFPRLPYLDWMEDSRRPIFVPTTDDTNGPGRLVIPLFGRKHLYGLISAWPLTHAEVVERAGTFVELRLSSLYLIRCREASRGRILKRSLSGVENERARIAAELHDESSQNLVALKVRLATAQHAIARGAFDDAVGIIEDCARIADEILDGVNRLSADLRPSELSYLGLRPAIEAAAEKRLEREGIRYEIIGNATDASFGALQERMLLAGVEEALSNCARHSSASLVEIEMRSEGGWFTIAVRDDGCGFILAGSTQGLGIKTMRDCAEEIGGDFWIGSVKGAGTTVRFSVPSSQLEEADYG